MDSRQFLDCMIKLTSRVEKRQGYCSKIRHYEEKINESNTALASSFSTLSKLINAYKEIIIEMNEKEDGLDQPPYFPLVSDLSDEDSGEDNVDKYYEDCTNIVGMLSVIKIRKKLDLPEQLIKALNELLIDAHTNQQFFRNLLTSIKGEDYVTNLEEERSFSDHESSSHSYSDDGSSSRSYSDRESSSSDVESSSQSEAKQSDQEAPIRGKKHKLNELISTAVQSVLFQPADKKQKTTVEPSAGITDGPVSSSPVINH